jgi:hypothetical protein
MAAIASLSFSRSARNDARTRVRLSQTSKLGCLSWSLIARDTCPGSIDPKTKDLVPACSGCYAVGGNYRYPNVKAPREFNREDWERTGWEDDMVQALENESHFRWFDSGDMYALGLALKIFNVMQRTPWCKHWLPTRMYKFDKFAAVLAAMQALPNVMVRPSSDAIDGSFEPGVHGSTILGESSQASGSVFVCGAYTREGKCGECRACWNKDVPVIAYPAHGKTMAKVIRLAQAA